MELVNDSSDNLAKYNLTNTISKYLDNHLIIPLLEFLYGRNVFSKSSVLKAQLEILKETNMIDCIINVYQLIHSDDQVPEDFENRKSLVIKKLEDVEEDIRSLIRVTQSDEFLNTYNITRDTKIINEMLKENYGITSEQILNLFTMAKMKYEIGDYNMAVVYSSTFRMLVPNDDKKAIDTKWGELAMEILLQNWDKAYDLLEQLIECIDNMPISIKQKNNQRSYLMHRSLFIFYNRQHGRNHLLNLFINKHEFLLALETICPHLLRYVVVAIIATKTRGEIISTVISLIKKHANVHSDPIITFFRLIFDEFNLESASQIFSVAQNVVDQDFFAVACKEEFSKCGKELIFEMICKIYSTVLISDLGKKFLISLDDIYGFDLDNKFNYSFDIIKEQDMVKIKSSVNSIHFKIIEKTKNIHSKLLNVQINNDQPVEFYESALNVAQNV